jgi:hypothetical protein
MLHKYHVIYSVRYYPRFYVTAVGLWNVLPVDTGANLYLITMLAKAVLYLSF